MLYKILAGKVLLRNIRKLPNYVISKASSYAFIAYFKIQYLPHFGADVLKYITHDL